MLAQQRPEIQRRTLVAELDAAAVDRLGLLVTAHPTQHAGEIVGRVDLTALQRPPIPAFGRTKVRRLGTRGRVAEIERSRRVPRLGRRRRPPQPRLAAAVAVGELVQALGRLAITPARRALEPLPRAGIIAAPLVHEPDMKGRVRLAALGRHAEMTLGRLVITPLLGPTATAEVPHERRVPAKVAAEAAPGRVARLSATPQA